MPVRTKRLAVNDSSPAQAEKIIYVVPSGETAILKSVHVTVASGTVTRAVVFVNSGPRRISLVDKAVSAVEVVNVQPYLVAAQGDSVGVFSAGGVVNVWLSGTELEGVAD